MSTVVLAVHFQNDVVHPDGKLGAAAGNPDLLLNARRLLDGSRSRGLPVVSLRIVLSAEGTPTNAPVFSAALERGAVVEGTWGAEFIDELGPRAGEHVVTHSRINGFHESELGRVLAALDAHRLVVAGVATHSSVEHTARHATDLGYQVVIVADACATSDPELHAAALKVLAPHVARIASVDEVLDG